MKKFLANKKLINIVLVAFCFTILLLVIGYIFLSIELKKQKDNVDYYDIVFTDIQKYSSIKGSSVEPTGTLEINEAGNMLSCKFELSAFNDELIYIAKIKKNGNRKAKITKVLQSPDYSLNSFSSLISPVTISISDIEEKTLEANEETELKISVYYNPSSKKAVKKTILYNVGLLTKYDNS